jgi:hypothetical protein
MQHEASERAVHPAITTGHAEQLEEVDILADAYAFIIECAERRAAKQAQGSEGSSGHAQNS